jgi:hypothetical protein
VQDYSVVKTYGHLLGKLEKAFAKDKPLFALALYYPLAYPKDPAAELNPWELNRQKQLVRLIRILFLKRFESSIVAFESSCQNLLLKLLAFLDKNIDPAKPAEVNRLEKWRTANAEVLSHIHRAPAKGVGFAGRMTRPRKPKRSGTNSLDKFQPLDRAQYRIGRDFRRHATADLEHARGFSGGIEKASHPPMTTNCKALVKLLKSDADLKKRKVLVFTEYMATARYLKHELQAAGIQGVDEVDSATEQNRTASTPSSGLRHITTIRQPPISPPET